MIFPLSGGGSAKVFALTSVTYPAGATCTCTNGSVTLTAEDTSGSWLCAVPSTGTWTVTATQGSNTVSRSVTISFEGQYTELALSFALVLFDAAFASGYYCTSNYITPALDMSQYTELEVTCEFTGAYADSDLRVGFSSNPAGVAYGSPPAAELVFSASMQEQTKTLDISSLTGNMHLGVWMALTYSNYGLSVSNGALYMSGGMGTSNIYKITLR